MRQVLPRLILLATALALVGCIRYSPIRYAYWDSEVERLCKLDGGVTVYERVRLSPSEYRLMRGPGESVAVPVLGESTSKSPYVRRWQPTATLNPGNPVVTRSVIEIVRLKDNRVMSRLVYYSRSGQDLVSSYDCKDAGLFLDLEKQTFGIPEQDRKR